MSVKEWRWALIVVIALGMGIGIGMAGPSEHWGQALVAVFDIVLVIVIGLFGYRLGRDSIIRGLSDPEIAEATGSWIQKSVEAAISSWLTEHGDAIGEYAGDLLKAKLVAPLLGSLGADAAAEGRAIPDLSGTPIAPILEMLGYDPDDIDPAQIRAILGLIPGSWKKELLARATGAGKAVRSSGTKTSGGGWTG